MHKIQVFILSHDRPNLLHKSLSSVLAQSRPELFEVIVSDNSTADGVALMMGECFPDVTLRRRVPALSPNDHFCAILSEVKSEYFIAFHDDDIMLPNMVCLLYDRISCDTALAAVAANSYIVNGKNKNFGLDVSVPITCEKLIGDVQCFVKQYLGMQGVAPFCGYIYRSAVYKNNCSHINLAGKHSDVTFIMSGLERGYILWLAQPLMYTVIHSGNDSGELDYHAIRKLCHCFSRVCQLDERSDRFFSINISYWLMGQNCVPLVRKALLGVVKFKVRFFQFLLLILLRRVRLVLAYISRLFAGGPSKKVCPRDYIG